MLLALHRSDYNPETILTKEELIAQLRALDTDGSGQVNVAEMVALNPGGDAALVQRILKLMDADADAQVDVQEFIAFYRQQS